jgi:hypothetical protein
MLMKSVEETITKMVVPAENSLPTKIGTGKKSRATSCDEPAHGRSLYYKRLSRDPDLNAIHTRIRRRCGTGRRATNGKQ